MRDGRLVPVVEPGRGGQAGSSCSFGDLAALGGVDPHRLLDPERLAGRHRRHGDLVVQEVGGADGDHVHVGGVQHLVVVGHGALEPERQRGLLVRRYRIRRGDQPGLHPEFGVALSDLAEAAGV